jgi:hypothetical protein
VTTAPVVLSDALVEIASGVTVSEDGRSAVVADETLETDAPHVLIGQLSHVLYQVAHTGRDKAETSRPRTLRDRDFDQILTQAMPHTTTRAEAVIEQRLDDGTLLVSVGGLRVLLPSDTPLDAQPRQLPGRGLVSLPAARPALPSGFFVADGSAGTGVGSGPHTLRLYAHVAHAQAAPDIWRAALSYLEDEGLPYRAKIISHPKMFPRRDALVIYLAPGAWQAVPGIAACLTATGGSGALKADVSPFTHPVAPGVSVAWEPQDTRPGMRSMSFGEHRSNALAQGLVRHAVRTDGIGLRSSLAEAFLDAGIEPVCPARNFTSPPLAAIGLL